MASHNSTIVRFLPSALRGLGAIAPGPTAALLGRLFLRTPPRRQPRSPVAPAQGAPRQWPKRGLVGEAWAGPTADSPTVLLVHGWGGRRTQLSSFVQPLREAGFAVVAFDAPGHGDSAGSTLSLPIFARAIRHVARTLPPLAAIIAHSFGGPASVMAIRDGLVVPRFVTIGAPADPSQWFEGFCRQLGVSAALRPRVRAAIEAQVGLGMGELAVEVIGPGMRTTALVVHDEADVEVAFADSQRLVAATKGATALVTRGLGHRKILRDATVIDEVVRFVAMARPVVCSQCGARVDEDLERALCMTCSLEGLLAHREERWLPAA